MKVGIVGGSFNPIHIGHINIGKVAREFANLDEIWFMPNANPPHKNNYEHKRNSANITEMVKLAILKYPYMRLCDFELSENNKPSYSYKTMENLKICYPDIEFYFVIGSDSLMTLNTWAHPERLLKSCKLLVATRSQKDFTKLSLARQNLIEKYECNIVLMDLTPIIISSSQIRNNLMNRRTFLDPNEMSCSSEENSYYDFLDVNVLTYILKNNLYLE